ncbi:MAG: ATP-binding protein, partial [Vicinamibacterales bacterium]|nr:ATP-binding protein [Vicinamibacterales bacterium]
TVETGAPADIECAGGLRIYAVPILAGGRIVGSVNFGYGDPPRDRAALEDLAARYQVAVDDLRALAAAYETRPPFIIEVAKRRLAVSARLIGEIVERKQTEQALRASEERFAHLFERAPLGYQSLDADGRFIEVNEAWCSTLGYERGEVLGKWFGDFLAPGYVDAFRERFPAFKARGVVHTEFEMLHHDGKRRTIVFDGRIGTAKDGSFEKTHCILQDVTERRHAEQERELLREQLAQARKMESVGRLAGGVAHDFNNMLGVILGHTEMALDQLDPSQPLFADLQEIRKAAERSVDLTRQLLAFARKQTIAPRVLDLNETVEGMLKMIRRLIGEDIELTWLPGPSLGAVKMDPSQLDQILANLCVNARDAIGGVGRISIETAAANLDDAYCAEHLGFEAGEYALLAVSDTGRGMDAHTVEHLFEPFFTTKDVGKGTGLGLATVYGIVKQNNGCINVYSEPGRGTTFRIYLPRHAARDEGPETDRAPERALRGRETILLVEDEAAILKMTTLMLERQGYAVLAASSPGESLRLAEAHAGRIDLLITDVVMPEMNGRDLARNLLALYPNLKRLFMSGYTADVIAHHGVLDPGVHFIQKPFSTKDLAAKTRDVLDHDAR